MLADPPCEEYLLNARHRAAPTALVWHSIDTPTPSRNVRRQLTGHRRDLDIVDRAHDHSFTGAMTGWSERVVWLHQRRDRTAMLGLVTNHACHT